jgi:hypothetical protein
MDRSKRYLLFAGDHQYPSGGIEDLQGTFDTPEEARAAGEEGFSKSLPTPQPVYDWFHIVDRETMERV